MAKKTSKKVTKKKAARPRKAVVAQLEPERVVRTYRVVHIDRDPELVRCHGVNVYGSCCEFVRFEETPRDPDGEWVTVLVLPAASFERVEFVDDNPIDGTGDGITDLTEVPATADATP
jgi:hypothetical protein